VYDPQLLRFWHPAAAFPFSDLEFPAENASTLFESFVPVFACLWISINLRVVRSAVGTVDKSKIRDKPFTTDRRTRTAVQGSTVARYRAQPVASGLNFGRIWRLRSVSEQI
jgi:hypothetical protein